MLAAYKLANDSALYNQGEAIVTIVNEGKAFAAVRKSNLAPLARQLAEAARQADDAFSEDPEALEDARTIFGQVAPYAFLDPSIFAGADLDVAKTTDAMVAAIKSSAHCRDFAEGNLNERYFREVCRLTLGRMLADKAYIDAISLHLWRESLERQGVQLEILTQIQLEIRQNEAKAAARHEEMMAALQRSEVAEKAREGGVTEDAILSIVRPIAADIDNVRDALNEFRRLVEIERKNMEEQRLGSNLGDFVDGVMRRAAALSAEGRRQEVVAEIEDAFQREKVESVARKLRLLSRLIDEHLLLRDAKGAAREIARRTEIDSDGQTDFFRALISEQETWMDRGRRQGTRIDLEVSVELARSLVARAGNRRERGLACDRLGLALRSLGELAANLDNLNESLKAFETARGNWQRERNQDNEALSRLNVGCVHFMIGHQTGSVREIAAAVSLYNNVRSNLPTPLRLDVWAALNSNEGIALCFLGERQSSPVLLMRAISALDAAIEARRRQGNRLEWAGCHVSLVVAWVLLGYLDNPAACGAKAIQAYEQIASFFDKDREPGLWSRARHGFGIAKTFVGEATGDEGILQESIEILDEVIDVRSSHAMAFDRIVSESAQGRAKIARAELTKDMSLAEQAWKQLVAAEKALRAFGHIHYADNELAQIERARRFLGRQP